jgi:hypothetical protein
MKLLDRIALQRLVSMILTFILAVLKLLVPQNTGNDSVDVPETDPESKPKRKRIFPRGKK